uniref:Uncharacterized protein n=1 Tax=Glycine max TaxID=3847 RepID=C6TLM3_SOYBN|nr:unknown [Glycine max]
MERNQFYIFILHQKRKGKHNANVKRKFQFYCKEKISILLKLKVSPILSLKTVLPSSNNTYKNIIFQTP